MNQKIPTVNVQLILDYLQSEIDRLEGVKTSLINLPLMKTNADGKAEYGQEYIRIFELLNAQIIILKQSILAIDNNFGYNETVNG